MDFGTLLHMAKKNNDSSKQSSSYYSTKFAPPKKESKEKKLSDNIQKFLQKREQEERERKRLEKEKVNKLLSMRDEKSKNKIRKMLKVTKSANKSVLDDAISTETALTLEGPQMGDQDDYGYVSTTANAFYQKYIEKVKDVKEDKGFAPSRPNSISDLKGTKDRVKAAITREIEDKKGSKQRSINGSLSLEKTQSKSSASISVNSSRKSLYDPEAERREEERKKREEEQKRAKKRKPAPPPMDFQSLLKLAEKRQHEPIALPVEAKKPKEPERLLTSKEKRELEERKKAKEARERREKEREQNPSGGSSTKDIDRKESSAAPGRMEPNGRIPKLKQSPKQNLSEKNNALNKNISSKTTPTTKTQAQSSKNLNTVAQDKTLKKPASANLSRPALVQSSSKPSASAVRKDAATTSSNAIRRPYEGPTREFPPRDMKPLKTRTFPPLDVRRSAPVQTSQTHKRRILDDDDDEEEDYDSEMDDFIDDGDAEEDYSKHIQAIFGYDKSKYRDLDDFDDRAMESNFAQVQREEFISKKIGLQEDLEDMKQEALEKKRKMMKKKKI